MIISTIPRPLLDRMEIIEVTSYTENEKYHIANDYLVKKQMEANGLDDTQIHWKEDVLRFLISIIQENLKQKLERRIGQGFQERLQETFTSEETQKSYDHKEGNQNIIRKTSL